MEEDGANSTMCANIGKQFVYGEVGQNLKVSKRENEIGFTCECRDVQCHYEINVNKYDEKSREEKHD